MVYCASPVDQRFRWLHALLGLVVAAVPCLVEARPGLPRLAAAVGVSATAARLPRLRSVAPALTNPWTDSRIVEEPAPPPGRAIDPSVPMAVPSLTTPPPPAPAIHDPPEPRIERPARAHDPVRPPEPEEEPRRGLGPLIAGSALVVPGTLAILLGFAVRGTSTDWCIEGCDYTTEDTSVYSGAVPFTFGALSFAASAILLTIGGLQHREWRSWKARQPPPPPPPPSSPSQPRGIGMMITGGSLAGPAAIYSFVVLGVPDREDPASLSGAILGGLSVAAGVTLLVLGARRNIRYKQWRDNQTMVPTSGRTVYGTWTAGLALRF